MSDKWHARYVDGRNPMIDINCSVVKKCRKSCDRSLKHSVQCGEFPLEGYPTFATPRFHHRCWFSQNLLSSVDIYFFQGLAPKPNDTKRLVSYATSKTV
jgi:hypothetical protein